jgi:hypothetical protein
MKRYSEAEIEFIKNNYLDLSYEQIAKQLDRPTASVNTFINDLGLKKVHRNERIKIGQKYGSVLIVSLTNGRTEQGSKLWECECDCGNRKVLGTETIHRKASSTCYCNGKTREKGEASILTRKYHKYKSGATVRNLPFNLTKSEFKSIIARPCHYCGINGPNGIDRKNNYLGYTLDNSLPCCSICNIAKRDMNYETFITYLHRISTFYKNQS